MMPEAVAGVDGEECPANGADQHKDVARCTELPGAKHAPFPMRDDQQHAGCRDGHSRQMEESELFVEQATIPEER